MRICAYTYEADIHCIDCARKRFVSPESQQAPADDKDANGLLLTQEDSEGNTIQPVFGFESILNTHKHCGTCNSELQY